jgi:hypothetical protein
VHALTAVNAFLNAVENVASVLAVGRLATAVAVGAILAAEAVALGAADAMPGLSKRCAANWASAWL